MKSRNNSYKSIKEKTVPAIETQMTKKELVNKIVYIALRVLIVLYVVLLFLPGINPARITSKINRNLSLFTSGFFYKSLTDGLGRSMQKGWIPTSTIRLTFIASMICCLGALCAGAGGCLSVGNNKLKRIGNFLTFGGGLVGAVSIFGIRMAQNQLQALVDANPDWADKTSVLNPFGITFFMTLASAVALLSIVTFATTPAPAKDEKAHIEPKFQLFLMFLPFAVLLFVFAYLPLWGWRYAFFDYSAGGTLSMDKFRGLYWFTYLFKNAATAKHIGRVMLNTLAMSGIGIAFSWLPMVFAIFLSEVKNPHVKRIVQTCTTVPNFISWVLVYAVAFAIFSSDGFVSSLMMQQGIWDKGKNMLMSGEHTWLKMWAWGTWKGLGWSAIIYLSAISGIDQQLYEAATVDGAGRFQKMWHITLPELIPTYCVLLTLSIAGILSNGMEQYLVFENPQNTAAIEVLDLYVYKIGINGGLIPLSTVVGMLKSIISVVLLFLANNISKLVRGQSVV
jgi:putative aldouronate transport system permease protein